MFLFIFLLLSTAHIAFAADDTGPVKSGNPNVLVAQVFTNMLKNGVTLATELNGGNAPTGDINKPYEQIASMGYLAYTKEHPEMLDDAKPFIASVNDNENAQSAWQIVLAAKRTASLAAREKALNLYYDAANVPLAEEEKKVIPDLKLAPFMVGIMLANQKLELDKGQTRVWNAIFASTASILQAMETEDPKAFNALYLPNTCALQ